MNKTMVILGIIGIVLSLVIGLILCLISDLCIIKIPNTYTFLVCITICIGVLSILLFPMSTDF